MKKCSKFLATALGLTCALGAFNVAGCKEKIPNDPNTLEIYVGKFGYGVEWLDAAIASFKSQSWVQEKYPNLNIPTPKNNSDREYAGNRIAAGASANTTDLFFCCVSSAGRFGTKTSDGNYLFEDLTDVYDSTVPGEEITVKAKMNPSIYAAQDVQNLDGTTAYYAMPWVNGYEGLLYNKTLMDGYFGEGNYTLPRTTNELLKLAADIKGKDASRAVFISASQYGYWSSAVVQWWAQYEGMENYENYWEGVNEYDERTPEVFSQTGRLRSLEVVESLIGNASYRHSDTNTMSFTAAQAKFLLGEAVIMQNGDWFENEMRTTAAENPNNFDIQFMKAPVISAITEKCTVVKTDADLAKVVDCVDQGKDLEATKTATGISNLTANDFNRIKEARTMMYGVIGHEAYIPSYATAKDVAKDFLRFLATDIAIESFTTVTHGVATPFQYDLETKNPTLYENLPTMQKSKLDIVKTGSMITPYTSFRLHYLGGMYTFVRTANIEASFTASNVKDKKSAQKIWQDEIDYFTADNNSAWNSLLNKAGMN